jgi:hypothetical protein
MRRSRLDLSFRRDSAALAVCHRGEVLVRIVADERWPGMWRVQCSDGRLTDMTNIARAKDAASSIALAILKAAETAAETEAA